MHNPAGYVTNQLNQLNKPITRSCLLIFIRNRFNNLCVLLVNVVIELQIIASSLEPKFWIMNYGIQPSHAVPFTTHKEMLFCYPGATVSTSGITELAMQAEKEEQC